MLGFIHASVPSGFNDSANSGSRGVSVVPIIIPPCHVFHGREYVVTVFVVGRREPSQGTG